MPLSQLDETPALVLIDLQKGIVAIPTAHPAAKVAGNAARLADAFRRHGLPVVLVNVTGSAPGRTEAGGSPPGDRPADWAEIVAELHPQPSDLRISKQRWGAFHGTTLDQQLRERGVTQIVLGGISTSIGVESSARDAYELGYHVVLAVDAMTDRNAESHRHSVERIFPRLGERASTAEIIDQLERRAGG